MKFFEIVQKNLTVLGYMRSHDGYHYYPFSMRSLVAIEFFIGSIISFLIFALHSADSPGEFMDSFYLLAVSLTIFVSYMTTIFKMAKLFDFFDECEKIFDESKFYCVQIL